MDYSRGLNMPRYEKQSIQDRIDNNLHEDYILDHNFEVVNDFVDFLKAQNIGERRIKRYICSFKKLAPHIDFKLDRAEKSDIVGLVGLINQNELDDKELSPHTLAEYRKFLKKFYKWNNGGKEPDKTKFFSVNISKRDQKLVDPENLADEENVLEIVQNGDRARNKALIMTLWESGARIGELMDAKWKDYIVKDDLASLKLDGKTGKRKVPIKRSIEYLEAWKQKHPTSSDESYLFTPYKFDRQLSYACMRKAMNQCIDGVETNFKTNPHAFRKSRATYLASKGMNQAQLCEYFGWVYGSDEAEKYIRLAQSDLEEAFQRAEGYI